MSSDKKLTVKRLVIFLCIAFIPFYIVIPVLWSVYGKPLYCGDEDLMAVSYAVGVFGMMIPSAANLLTRLITKEGFRNSYLGANFRGRMGYWTASVAVKLIEGVVMVFLMWKLYMSDLSLPELFPEVGLSTVGMYLAQILFSVVIFFPAFGEEWGWRGYMMPKLLEIMPKPAAVMTGGVIWGLWHAPLTVAGHNFGLDYPGYPFVGIGIMCLMCTLMNAFLTLVTEKTHSVYPAAFIHALNNNLGVGALFAIFGGEAAAEKLDAIGTSDIYTVMLPVFAVTGIISFILLMRKEKPAAAG